MNDQFAPENQPKNTSDNAAATPEPNPYSQPGYPQAGYPQTGYPQGAPQEGPYQYQQPGQYPYPPVPMQQPTDGLAIASLVTGILGMGLVPLILGLVSLNKIKKTGAQGRGMAIAGVILGALTTILYVILLILFVIGVFAAINSDSFTTSTGTGTSVTSATTRWATVEDELQDYPELRPLYDSCADGDMLACDDLYMQSNFGGHLEEFGDTCGGRNHGGDMCGR